MQNNSNSIEDFGLKFDFNSMEPGTLFTFENICLSGFQIGDTEDLNFEFSKEKIYVLPLSVIIKITNTKLLYSNDCTGELFEPEEKQRYFAHAEEYYIEWYNKKENRQRNPADRYKAKIESNIFIPNVTHMPILIKHICNNLSKSSLLFLGTRDFGISTHPYNHKPEYNLDKKRIEKRPFGEFMTGAGQKVFLDNSQIMKVRSLKMLTDAFRDFL